MRRLVAVVLAVALVLPVGGVATAHGNDVEADAQISADGTVLVENVLLVVDGFVVVHRNGSDGRPGEVIGHAAPTSESPFLQSVRVPIEPAAWSNWGDARSVWVVIHRDEGRDGFDPGEDPMERSFGTITGERIQLGKGEREASVVAAGFTTQRTATDAVTVRRVAIDRDGLLVVRPETASGDGRVLGATALAAGVHENVSVPIDGSVFTPRDRRVTLVAQLYAGDGPTVDEGDRPLRVGGVPVATTVTVGRTGPLTATRRNESGVAGPTAAAPTTRPLVITATPVSTTRPGDGAAPSARAADRDGTPVGGAEGSAAGPGPGVSGAAIAVLACAGAIWLARRRAS